MKNNFPRQIGFWSSIFLVALGVIYLVLLVFQFSIQGFSFPPSQSVQLTGGIITFLTVPLLVILYTAIHFTNTGNKKILSSLGVSFSILFAATVSINRFVQLTVIQQGSQGATSGDLTRFLPYSSGSIMFALEMLGWGYFSSLAALSIAPLFSSSRLNLSIRWMLVTYALFSLLSVIGYAIQSPISAAGFIAWGPILTALAILLVVYFRKSSSTEAI